MRRRLLVSYLVLTAFVVVVLAVPLGVVFADRERERLVAGIERDARVIVAQVEEGYEARDEAMLITLAAQYASRMDGRVVLVDDAGRSIADSADLEGASRDFSSRPEIRTALRGRTSSGERSSDTLDTSLYYAAVPVVHEGRVLGAVRVTYESDLVEQRSHRLWIQVITISAAVALAAGAAGWFISATLTRPLRRLDDATRRLAGGDLGARVGAVDGPPEVREVAGAFDLMAERVERSIEGQREFLADASHQLRTPLTALRLRLDALAATSPEGEADRDLEAAQAEVDRLSAMVDGLLAMARLDARPGPPEPADADDVVAERVAMWAPLAEERGVELRADGRGGWCLAPADGLEQILDNLIANALEVAPDGTRIDLRLARDSATVHLIVRDHGPGLAPEEAARAFDRFWRGSDAGPGGSGLGLAIVERLARAAGGSVRIEHPTGGGLAVVVRLPAAAEPLH